MCFRMKQITGMQMKIPLAVAVISLWMFPQICAYCPVDCTCTHDSAPNVVEKLSSLYNITEVICQISRNDFHINAEAERILPGTNDRQRLSLSLQCEEGTNIMWTDADFLKKTVAFSVVECKLSQNRGQDIVFPQDTPLRYLAFKYNGGEDFFHEIDFRGIRKLERLIIHNSLTRIPKSLKSYSPYMFFLWQLNLSFNKLSTLDCKFIENLFYLQQLMLSGNLIESVPLCLCTKQRQLSSLDLSDNEITSFDKLLCEKQPRQIDLSLNRITHIGMFPRRSELMTLDLSYNEISAVESNTFADLMFLQTINLNNNKISSVGKYAFGNLPRLTGLHLNHNQLTSYEMSQAPNLQLTPVFLDVRINLSDNKLKYPPFHSDNYTFPVYFKTEADNNPYQCDCEIVKFQKASKDGKLASLKEHDSLICDKPHELEGRTLQSLDFANKCPIIDDCPRICQCEHNLTSGLTAIQCAGKNIAQLPKRLPRGKLVLQFATNSITEITRYDYSHRIVKLDLSDNQVSNVSDSALTMLSNIEELRLDRNQIRTVPLAVKTWKPRTLRVLTLYENPWKCDCDTVWFQNWLKEMEPTLLHSARMRCFANGEYSTPVMNTIISCSNFKELAIIMATLAVLILLVGILIYVFRMEIKLLIFMHFDWHPFDQTELLPKKYDAFISYSEDDSQWVHHELVKLLEEDHDPPFRTCFHHRDFVPGVPIAANIQMAIDNSQCTVIVLSPGFIASDWCVFEFQTAHASMLNKETGKVIIIIKEDVDVKKLSPELKSYLNTMTYLKANDKWFDKKLYYSLPHKQLIQQDCEQGAEMEPMNK